MVRFFYIHGTYFMRDMPETRKLFMIDTALHLFYTWTFMYNK
jgi:hypothetical protein